MNPGRRSAPPPPLLAVDVIGALHVVGDADRLPEPRHARAGRGRDRLRRAGLAVPRVAGAIVGGIGLGVTRATRGEHRLGIREGFLVVALTWLAAAALGALPYILSGDPQLDRPVDAYFEGMSGFSTTGGSIVVDVEALPRASRSGASSRSGSAGSGSSCSRSPCCRGCASAAGSCSSTRCPGPEIETLSTRIRDTARRVWILYIGLTAALFAILLALGDRRRRGDDTVPGVRARADDDPDRRLLDRRRLDRGLRRGDPVGDRRLHDPRRDQLRAHVPRDRAPAAAGAGRDEELRLYLALLARLDRRRDRDLDRGRPRAGRASARRSSRPSRR